MAAFDRRGTYRLNVFIEPDETMLTIGRGTRRPLAAVINDLSAGGARLTVLFSDLREGQHLTMHFDFGAEEFRVAAEVRWVRQGRRGSGQYIGVRFTELSAADRKRIVGQITREQRRRTRDSA